MIYRKASIRKKFTPQEDQFLRIIAQDGNQMKWSEIAMIMNEKYGAQRTGRHYFERWKSFFQQEAQQYQKNQKQLKSNEVQQIITCIENYGLDFKIISQCTRGKTYLSIITIIKYTFIRAIRKLEEIVYHDLQHKINKLSITEIHKISELMTRKNISTEELMVQVRTQLIKLIKSEYNSTYKLSNAQLLELYDSYLQQFRNKYETYEIGRQVEQEDELIVWNYVEEKRVCQLFYQYGKKYDDIINVMRSQRFPPQKCRVNLIVYKIVMMIRTGVGIHAQIIKEKHQNLYINMNINNKERIAQRVYKLQPKHQYFWIVKAIINLNFNSDLKEQQLLLMLKFMKDILKKKEQNDGQHEVEQIKNSEFIRAELKNKLKNVLRGNYGKSMKSQQQISQLFIIILHQQQLLQKSKQQQFEAIYKNIELLIKSINNILSDEYI